jgi:hypothetical protein
MSNLTMQNSVGMNAKIAVLENVIYVLGRFCRGHEYRK